MSREVQSHSPEWPKRGSEHGGSPHTVAAVIVGDHLNTLGVSYMDKSFSHLNPVPEGTMLRIGARRLCGCDLCYVQYTKF